MLRAKSILNENSYITDRNILVLLFMSVDNISFCMVYICNFVDVEL